MTVELEIAADELLSNAIYPKVSSADRRFAAPVSTAVARWTCADGCIHVSVTDAWGAVEKWDLISALRQIASTPADDLSLLGLPRQLMLAQRLVVNLVPGQQAELILSVPLKGRKDPVPSLGFHVARERPDEANIAAAEPVTINLNGQLRVEKLGLECEVSINEVNAMRAEVTLQEPTPKSIYPGVHFTLSVNVPFHGELRASGLVFRVQPGELPALSLSFATGQQEWERVLRTVLGGVPARTQT